MSTFSIHHITSYEYDRAVTESVNEIRIFPYQCAEQEVLQHDLIISGQPDLHIFTDYWGNRAGLFNLNASHTELVIESRLLVRAKAPAERPLNFNTGLDALEGEVPDNILLVDLGRPEKISNQAAIDEIVQQIFQPWKSVAAIVQDCCQFIYRHFTYIKGITDIETTVDEIIDHRSGVCQDFAHLMLQVLRTMQIPSRYVSGYICPNKNGLRGEGATHAWVEAWIPGFGWAGIDPTNNIWVSNTHIKLAVGRNFKDCSPVKGTFKGPAHQKMFVYVSVGYEDGHHFEEKSLVKLPDTFDQQVLLQESDLRAMQQ
ncbi:transglutaminase domain-containing protein [Flavihumibacter stibioxidans]|uniref:Transglutaminase n=1 Tax=Flavihumibacter stibioxidans TaxID=1834163 RepID=A0ABR7MD45_9BACT|nr:transglutaminase family protein [Flavihumibacter stibioxidans]MBC6492942.1 transglutaminase [Flavihumibacter stibioxidans]